MDALTGSLIAIVFIVVIMNAVALFLRLRRTRANVPKRAAMEEAQAARIRDNEVKRRIELEQDDALRHITLRNRTLALYDYVRRRAEAVEQGLPFEEPEPSVKTRELNDETPGLWVSSWGLGTRD